MCEREKEKRGGGQGGAGAEEGSPREEGRGAEEKREREEVAWESHRAGRCFQCNQETTDSSF